MSALTLQVPAVLLGRFRVDFQHVTSDNRQVGFRYSIWRKLLPGVEVVSVKPLLARLTRSLQSGQPDLGITGDPGVESSMLLRRAFVLGGVGMVRGQNRVPGMFANAEAYERFMGRWSRLLAPQLVEFAGLPQRGRFLDVGSGTGSLAFAIAETHREAHIVGIDPSQEYVAYASSKNPFGDRAKFEVGDAQRLSFGDSSFDAAVSLLVFNFIPQPGTAVSEVRRVTKPGGSVSAAVWGYGAGMRMLRVFWDAVVAVDPAAEKLDEKRMPLCRPGELSELWRQGGLEAVHERSIDIRTRFASFADYWEPFLLGQGPAGAYAHDLTPRKLTALRDEIKRRLGISSEAGPIELPARVWAVRGVIPSRG